MHADRPRWLDDEAEVAALLHGALDRFDRQRGIDRQRRISLAALEALPSLAHADAAADHTWGLVRELERLGVLAVRAGRRNPYDVDWHGAKILFAPEIEDRLRLWLERAWTEPAIAQWRRAIARHATAFHDGGAALASQRIVIENRSADEVVGALAGAAALDAPMTLRQLSATIFWGDSKVLDDRGDLVAALLPRLEIRERALVIAVHLPAQCEGVLFIENQDTYTAAAAGMPAEAGSLALVYAAGFRGSASRVRSRGGALLHYAGAGAGDGNLVTRFHAWWFDGGDPVGPTWFWGDLDFAGMQILKSLRGRFPGLGAWRVGYEPLREQLSVAGGYGGRLDDSTGQIDPGSTGCGYADSVLLPAIRQFGQRDQESRGR